MPVDHRARPAGPRNPFETYLLLACVVQGWAALSHLAQPPSLQGLLPPWLRVVWGTLLLGGGVFSVAGLYWTNPFVGIEIKRVGLCAACGGTLAYGVALLTVGPAGFVSAAANLGFAAACVTRVVQVTRALHAARRRMASLTPPPGLPRPPPPGAA